MQAGELKLEVTIQTRGETVNAIGESVASWSTYKATYADMDNNSGNEQIQAAQVNGFSDTMFTVRWDSGIRDTMRILFKSRHYNIVYIDNLKERDEEMHIFCKRQESATNG